MTTKTHGRAALERAIELAGGQSGLAEKIGGTVKQQHVWHWLHLSNGRVPAEYCRAIERVTGVPACELRPDVFGEAHQ
jgi:DNA-binding transcriptional regulator YdaS (Cro superfamily)